MGLLKKASGIVLVAGFVALAVTNPGPRAYETFAIAQLSQYVSSTVCEEIPGNLNQVLQNPCSRLLDNNHEEVRQLVREQTSRSNFVLFSLYETRLAVPGLTVLPAYEVKALGIGRNFFVYQAGQV
ncbi:MAG: DUF4359 domain-containing protein [Cyanobacteria bacterium P01_D01_bin.44]